MHFRVRSHLRQGPQPGTGFAGSQGWRDTISDGEDEQHVDADGDDLEASGQRLQICTTSELRE